MGNLIKTLLTKQNICTIIKVQKNKLTGEGHVFGMNLR